jgi:hypothetical protein
MAIKVQRNTGRSRLSRTLTLPIAWVNYYGPRIDRVTIMGSRCLIIAPEGLEDEAEKMLKAVENNEGGS